MNQLLLLCLGKRSYALTHHTYTSKKNNNRKGAVFYTLLFLLLATLASISPKLQAALYTYDNTSSQAIPNSSDCSSVVNIPFNVTESFNLTDIDIGLNITTDYKYHLYARIISPSNTSVNLLQYLGASNDNFDILIF